MKNTKSIIIGLICSILLTATVFAGTYPLETNMSGSIYSPDRSGVEYQPGILGNSFPSFNNFYSNPKINSGERNGQERVFTLAQHCFYDAANNDAPCGQDAYTNYHEVLPDQLQEGDKVRFEIYFHNNGEDNYEGGSEGSADAVNVEIGMDLNDIVIQASPLHLAPKGFIYADNNQYVTNTSNRRTNQVNSNGHVTNSNLLIKDSNGEIIRTASDSTWMERESEDLVLKPVPGSAALYVKTFYDENNSANDVYFDGGITQTTNVTFDTFMGDQTITITPHFTEDRMWLNFDRLPGCFRYSGFAYFEAVVERIPDETEPICEEILIDHPETIYEGTHSRFNSSVLNTDGDNFESDIVYWVDEGFGTLSLTEPTDVPANPSDYIFERIFQFLPIETIQIQLFTFNEVIKIAKTGIFDGLFGNVAHAITIGPVFDPGELFEGQNPGILLNLPVTQLTVPQGTPVYLTATNPGIHGVFHAKTVDSEVAACARDFDIIPYRVCKEIIVDHHETITDDGTLSQFSAVSLNPVDDIFYGTITYSVDPGYGQFFETKPTGYDDNTSPYIIEIPAETFPAPVPQGGWCSDVASQTQPGGGTLGQGEFTLQSGQIAPDLLGEWFWEGIDDEVLGGWAEQNESLFLDPGIMFEEETIFEGEPIIEMGTIQGFNSILHAANAEVIDPNTINVSPGQTVWFLPAQPGVDVIHVSADCTNEQNCERDFSIESGAENTVCQEILVNQPTTIVAGTLSEISAKPVDDTTNNFDGMIRYNVQPGTGQFFLTKPTGYTDNDSPMVIEFDDSIPIPTPQGGLFCSDNVMEPGTIMANPGQKVWLYAEQTGNTVVHIGTDCTDVLTCNRHLDIEASENICTGISVQDEGVNLVELNPGELYELTADAAYTGTPASEEVTFTSTQGLFFGPVTSDPLLQEVYRILIQDNLVGTISSNWINEPIPASLLAQLSQSITVNDGDLVFFVTFTDATGTDALTVQATNRGEAACVKTYDMAVQDQLCESIEVTYSPTPFNPDLGTIIVVQPGIYGDWTGEFEFSAPNGTFSIPGGTPATSFTQTSAAGGITYTPDGVTTDTDEITITATGPLNGGGVCNYVISPTPQDVECIDLSIVQPAGTWDENDFTDDNEQRFRIEVDTDPAGFEDTLTYRWEEDENSSAEFRDSITDHTFSNPLINYLEDINVNDDASVTIYAVDANGDPIAACRDTANFDVDDDNPGIDKVVYDPISRDWENVVNYGGRDENGDFIDPKYEWITYLSVFDPDGVESAQLWEDELDNGNIESANLGSAGGDLLFQGMVIAVEDNNGDQYVIYQTDGFETGRFRNEDYILNDDLEYFEDWDENNLDDKYDCDSTSSDFEADRVCIENYDNALIDFQRGRQVEFQNMEDAKYTYVFYQMENRTEIDEEFCRTMIEEFGTCGEEFKNEINFETPEGHEGKDDAKVVVVCPYILVREGGDIFFHDAIDTGIDVSACYEVESGEGGTFRPKKEDEGDVVSTGQGEEGEEITLIAPSHDLCKISNTEKSDIEAYRNVFKNFSSSVCEMETEVAEQWKEVHINNAIKANIEKLARFGINNADANILEVENEFNNSVYISSGDLTIQSDFYVPAGARTYIIQGGDLHINANIYYNDNGADVDITNPTTIPSVAFVVIDGNIIIDGDVTYLDGIYMAVDTEGAEGEDGRFLAKDDKVSYKLLTIQGSLVGDIYELYTNRKGVGDPLKDESSITVKYDQRILLNTAPGLNELIDISQLEVAN
ncbi:MAG: hypothetical protein GWP15_00965 [Nitrospirae bacterium]|nr:hypothetical protein [Nitrospirota bacterium]